MKKILALLTFYLTPAFALAATAGGVRDAQGLSDRLIYLGNLFVYILISLAIIYLIFGIVRYLIAGGDDAKTKGKDIIIRGIIGLAIIFSIWGLVALVVNVAGLGGGEELKGRTPVIGNFLNKPN